jgi:hypothetical protein
MSAYRVILFSWVLVQRLKVVSCTANALNLIRSTNNIAQKEVERLNSSNGSPEFSIGADTSITA